uniref:Glutathione transferase n=1 Tax=Chaetoceros debilis TaxID=122233 RepID=A0A7S3QJJ9_9STRA|mmetsp:Transcript_9277/g.13877  ORF Transcript_9277/g.13877 Transcript_9277/m.13877 type:complete len:236 (-) Transcript_9277:262-969(-)
MGGILCSGSSPTTETTTMVSSEKPVLVYWGVHGRSDFCQAMMAAGNIDYDLDTETGNAWPAAKEESPFGQIPYLKHGALTLGQGGALNRYCARIAGLYPSDAVEASICDMYMEEMMDIFSGLFPPNGAADKEAKITAWKFVQDSHLPKHYALLEKNLVKSGKPFLGGDKPNAADVAFFAVNNVYSKASIDTDKVLSDVAPTLQKALSETTKLGQLSNFAPDRGLYFSSDPENASF